DCWCSSMRPTCTRAAHSNITWSSTPRRPSNGLSGTASSRAIGPPVSSAIGTARVHAQRFVSLLWTFRLQLGGLSKDAGGRIRLNAEERRHALSAALDDGRRRERACSGGLTIRPPPCLFLRLSAFRLHP